MTLPLGPEKPNPFDSTKVDDVNGTTRHYILEHPWYLAVFAVNLILVLLLVWTVRDTRKPFDAFYLLIPSILLWGRIQGKVRDSFMKQFAIREGLSFTPNGSILDVEGKLFQIGDSQKIFDVASGEKGDTLFWIFFFSYMTGSGKSRAQHSNTVVEMRLPGEVPSIIVHHKEFLDLGVAAFGNGYVQLELEGDFKKFFTVSVEKNFEIEAYQIFTPDFMAELIDTAKNFNFEFFHDKLYIYKEAYVSKRTDLDAMFALAETLLKKIKPKSVMIGRSVESMEEVLGKEPSLLQ